MAGFTASALAATLDTLPASPRAGCVEAEARVSSCILEAKLKDEDVANLRGHKELVARHFQFDAEDALAFERLSSLAQARVRQGDEAAEARSLHPVDVLNAQGQVIMQKPRNVAHRNGMWHRSVNVWLLCPTSARVLIGQRSGQKDRDPFRWTCACGRVLGGQLSMDTAVELAASEFGMEALPEKNISLAFTMKNSQRYSTGLFAGHVDATVLDVYVMTIPREIPVERVLCNAPAKQDLKYISLADLSQAWEGSNSEYVLPPREYADRLIDRMRKICEDHGGLVPRVPGAPPGAWQRAMELAPAQRPKLGVNCVAWSGKGLALSGSSLAAAGRSSIGTPRSS